jgi:acetoin:2,6-dichlorophenolindophenol oxidoreductase subunit beta
MGKTTAETISEITRKHLTEDNGLLLGQCVTAVGWIGGTVPDCEGIAEIPMTDVAGPAFAVGCALMGRRPIFVVRYQGFMWYNSSSLINYAAKSKQVWNRSCPVFIRSVGMEGKGIGHTASSCVHSIFMHSPGLPVAAPMSSIEYQSVWDHFMEHDDPIYVSEHRRSFTSSLEMENIIEDQAEITIIAISASRFNAIDAEKMLREQNIKCDLFHLVWLKPFQPTEEMIHSLKKTKVGLIIDSDYEISGTSRSLAYELMLKTGVPVHALGLEDRVCGVAPELENITPSPEKIASTIKQCIQKKGAPDFSLSV